MIPRTNRGGSVQLVATRDIQPGEEVTNSYGLTFIESTKAFRQARFSARYKFRCACTACRENWPQFPSLERAVSPGLAAVAKAGLAGVEAALLTGDCSLASSRAIRLWRDLHTLPQLHALRQRCRILISTAAWMKYVAE